MVVRTYCAFNDRGPPKRTRSWQYLNSPASVARPPTYYKYLGVQYFLISSCSFLPGFPPDLRLDFATTSPEEAKNDKCRSCSLRRFPILFLNENGRSRKTSSVLGGSSGYFKVVFQEHSRNHAIERRNEQDDIVNDEVDTTHVLHKQ